mgnify:CR=1 FL=1
MAGTAVYKKDHTTRMTVLALTEVNGVDTPLDLSAASIEVKLQPAGQPSGAVVTLTLGSGVALGGDTGEFTYDVTVPNLATLGNPDQVNTTINVWDMNNVLLVTGTGVINVSL